MNDIFYSNALSVRYYKRPNGTVEMIDMTNIYEEDIKFFENGDYIVSMEELTIGDIAVYAYPSSEDEETEICVLDHGRSCEETMRALRLECERAFGETQ